MPMRNLYTLFLVFSIEELSSASITDTVLLLEQMVHRVLSGQVKMQTHCAIVKARKEVLYAQ